MNIPELLRHDEIISEEELRNIQLYESSKLFSLHWELRTLLYVGILLLTTGIGLLVYLNIDTIGHQVIIAAIAIASAVCFYYSFKNNEPYSNGSVQHPSPIFDYIALLACLLLATFIGYLQYQYQFFGQKMWVATGLPAIVFIISAYLFDHKGLLSLAISACASTIGFTVTPMQLLFANNFDSKPIVISAIAFGSCLLIVSKFLTREKIKQHFDITYNQFAINILFVACLTALFNYPLKPLSFLLLLAICTYYIMYAINNQSFLFILISVIFTYIGLSYSLFKFFEYMNLETLAINLYLYYFLASCGGIVYFLIEHKNIINKFYNLKK